MKHLTPFLIGAALLVGAALVHLGEPPEEMRQGPFEVSVQQGDNGVGRNIEVTFANLRFAETVESADDYEPWVGETEGTWLVVDVVAQTRVEAASIHSFLLIDGLQIGGSPRADQAGLEGATLSPGLPVAGVLLFQVPSDLVDLHEARVLVTVNNDWRLDSAISIAFDPSSIEVEDRARISEQVRVP